MKPRMPLDARGAAAAVSVALTATVALSSCSSAEKEEARRLAEAAVSCPIPGGVLRNDLIQEGETRFLNLWQITDGGENAEAYWSYGDDRLSLQITDKDDDEIRDCDRIFVTGIDGQMRQVSDGRGVTTCSFFMPDDDAVLYASTQSVHVGCPDTKIAERRANGEPYTWMLWPEYEIYVQDLTSGEERLLAGGYGYDAEATVSPTGDRIVFTSTRSGDLELWTCDLEGNDVFQVTDTLGYDGGAFFSHGGDKLVFRTTEWTPGNEAAEQEAYRRNYQQWRVQPNKMEIYTIDVDGTNRTQVTALGGANFAPYFSPDDSRIIFASNHHNDVDPRTGRLGLNFDLFMCDADGGNLERITTFDAGPGRQFDSFPMFSRSGRYLAFSSNRGAKKRGDTNVFVAEWIQ